VSKILGSICSLERLYFLKHYYPTHGYSIGGIHFGNEQIKEEDHIGMKIYAWNNFLKVDLNHPFINIPVQMHERYSHTFTQTRGACSSARSAVHVARNSHHRPICHRMAKIAYSRFR